MAQVPYSPITDVSTNYQPARTIHVDTPLDAFGGAQASAFSHLGAVSNEAANELSQRALAMQQLHNEAMHDDAVATFFQQASQIHAKFDAAEGANAGPEALQKYNQDIGDLRQQIRGSLPNPAVQRMFDSSSLSMVGRLSFSAAGHSAQELKQYAIDSAGAMGKSADDMIGAAPGNAAVVDDANKKKAIAATTISDLKGHSPESREMLLEDQRSGTVLTRIQAFIDQGRDADAAKVYTAAKADGSLAGRYYDKGQELLDRSMGNQASRIAIAVNGDLGPDATQAERSAEAIKRAKDLNPDHPELGKLATEATISLYNQQTRIAAEDEAKKWNVIDTALAQPKAPATITDLKGISPEIGDAVSKLSPQDQLKLQYKLKKAQDNDYVQTPERTTNYNKIIGAAWSDPTTLQKIDPYTLDLNTKQRNEIIRLQGQSLKPGQLDSLFAPAVEKTMGNPNVKMLLRNSGVLADKDQHDQFVGALTTMIGSQYAEGKVPTPDEQVQMATHLLQSVTTSKGFLFNTNEPVFSAQPTPEAKATLTKAYQKTYGRDPSDLELQRSYTRYLYNQTVKAGATGNE